MIVLPLPLNRANTSLHWRAEKRKRDAYMLRCTVMAPERPPKPSSGVRLTATLYLHQRMDADNLMARMKWPLDWLVERGWITDDNPEVIEWTEPPIQVIDRKNPRVVIELEPAPLVADRGAP